MNVPIFICYAVIQLISFFLSSQYFILLIGVFMFYLLYYNNLYFVKTSNVVLGLVTKIVVHIYTEYPS